MTDRSPPTSPELQPLAGPHLEIRTTEDDLRTHDLSAAVTRLGRGETNDVQLLDGRVSKQHAEIHRAEHGYVVRDVGSRAGVFVNGSRVEERALADGDVVTFGPFSPPAIAFRSAHRAPVPGSSGLLTTFAGRGDRDDLENLGRFLEFSRVFADGVALSSVLDQVVDVAMEITGAERGSLILTPRDGALEFEVVRERGKGAMPREGHRVSETIVREVVESRQPRVVSDVAHDAGLAHAHSVVSLQLGSAVAVPLWRFALTESEDRAESTDEVFGVLYLDSRKRRDAFSKLDIGLLNTLARDASSAIENARLLREAEDKRRMEREIRTAREVQAALLPESYWTEPHFEVSGSCVPCLDLGGDYLDQFRLPNGCVGFVVADVCGKGLPAALLAAAVQGAFAAEIESGKPLGEVVERVNRVVCRLASVGNFISLLCGVLSPDGELSYVNAGHCPLINVTKDGIGHLVTGGLALGLHDAASYEVRRTQMRDGDVAVLYTDGVLEAESPDGELFGEERLEAALEGCSSSSASDTSERILQTVDAFRADRPVLDDITLLVLRYVGNGDAPR